MYFQLLLINRDAVQVNETLSKAGSMIEQWTGPGVQKESLKVFFLVLQVCHYLSAGQVNLDCLFKLSCLAGRGVNALASHQCGPGSIPCKVYEMIYDHQVGQLCFFHILRFLPTGRPVMRQSLLGEICDKLFLAF